MAGTNPKKAGTDVEGIPVYATRRRCGPRKTGAERRLHHRPGGGRRRTPSSTRRRAAWPFIVCVTEHIPMHDQARVYNLLKRDFPNTRLLGPNCAGIISPGKANIGFNPPEVALPALSVSSAGRAPSPTSRPMS
ncbi:MAG: hypothetical protein V9E89_03580 [Ilumatobacteraceae bacterium]